MLLKDLIHIPESVQKSDFVIALEDGISDPKRVVDSYVVTDQLLGSFRKALDLTLSSVEDHRSKGAYLHGSFGAGKSHFMAILHLLLQRNSEVRAKPELAPILAEYDDRLEGKEFLLVPYHMVGAASMEAGVLGGYVDYVRRQHPDAPTPAVYLDDQLFEDAKKLRSKMGDEMFFDELGGSGGDDDGFGDLAAGWTAERFERAITADARDPDRRALSSDLIDAFFSSMRTTAQGTGEHYIEFADGLDVISQHAKSLGYDAVVLFLDELILWFASRMQDPSFVEKEGQKVAKLVEATAKNRPAPIISLIARQRDLREFLGEGVPGAEQLKFADSLEFFDSRFDTITLADTNLRAIVQKRLLKPKNDEARAHLDAAFDKVQKQAGSALDTLMTSEADAEAFRAVYPFSPAMIDTLVAVSAYLQRERTALRLLAQLLSEKADELEVGDLVPLGDLYDVIRGGEDPFSDQLKRHFESAKRLYENKLRPVLLNEYDLEQGELDALPMQHQARTGDRLLKTLVLASLVPDSPVLKGLTVRRLTDLNHGSIKTPVPGAERTVVSGFLTKWAPEIPELRMTGDDGDPTVSLQLTGVDIDAILSEFKHVDNDGQRIALVRRMVFEALEIDDRTDLFAVEKRFEWRGTTRMVDVRFGNVRDPTSIPEAEFRAQNNRPRIVIDFPFDPGHGPMDDLARINDELRESLPATPTVAWLPMFMTDAALERLGRLVILEHVMGGDRLDGATRQLSPQDREQAKTLIMNQRHSLRTQMLDILRQAYGIESPKAEWVQEDGQLSDQFPSLDPTLTVRPPTRPSMLDSFKEILDQVFEHLYPAHPQFESKVTKGDLAKCLHHVIRAAGSAGRRAEVPTSDRPAIRKVLGPLEIADTGEAHLTLRRDWEERFHRKIQANPGVPVTVGHLREWIDDPKPRGLDAEMTSLVIQAWAVQDNRILMNAGLQLEPEVRRLDDHVEVRTQALPSEEAWDAAVPRLNAIFGVDASPLRNASNVATAMSAARDVAREHADAVARLDRVLDKPCEAYGVPEDAVRRANAHAAQALVDTIVSTSDDVAAVEHLAELEVPSSEQALGRSIKHAGSVADAVERTNWDLLALIEGLGSPWETEAQKIRSQVRQALERDELSTALAPVLSGAEKAATELIARANATNKPAPPKPKPGEGPEGGSDPEPGDALAAKGNMEGDDARIALKKLAANADRIETLRIEWTLRSE